MNIIELKKINKFFGQGNNRVHVLKNIDLSIEKGDFVAIIGQSGSGKSTLMNIIGCLDVPTSGSYKINNVEVKGSKSLADYDIESASEAKKEFENLNSEINTHEKNEDIHVSREDRLKWDSGTTYTVSKENLIIGGK